jgi:excisionase family DNA binding protein
MNFPHDAETPGIPRRRSNDDQPKNIYTTGMAAKLLEVSKQTVIRLFDAGRLAGFRVPGTKFRRIPHDALVKFMKEKGIPLDSLASGRGTAHRDRRAGRAEEETPVNVRARNGPKTNDAERMPIGCPVNAPARLLLVIEDLGIVYSLSQFLTLEGYQVDTEADELRAIEMLETTRYCLVLTEVTNGLRLLWTIRNKYPDVVVLVVAGYGMIEMAAKAVKMGAFDYLIWPIIDDEIRVTIQKALKHQTLLSENHQLRHQLGLARPR